MIITMTGPRRVEPLCRAPEVLPPRALKSVRYWKESVPANQPGTEEVEEEEFEDAKGDIENDDEVEGHVELHQRGDTPKEAEDSQELDEGKSFIPNM